MTDPIVCPRCGAKLASGASRCGTCHAFVAWWDGLPHAIESAHSNSPAGPYYRLTPSSKPAGPGAPIRATGAAPTPASPIVRSALRPVLRFTRKPKPSRSAAATAGTHDPWLTQPYTWPDPPSKWQSVKSGPGVVRVVVFVVIALIALANQNTKSTSTDLLATDYSSTTTAFGTEVSTPDSAVDQQSGSTLDQPSGPTSDRIAAYAGGEAGTPFTAATGARADFPAAPVNDPATATFVQGLLDQEHLGHIVEAWTYSDTGVFHLVVAEYADGVTRDSAIAVLSTGRVLGVVPVRQDHDGLPALYAETSVGGTPNTELVVFGDHSVIIGSVANAPAAARARFLSSLHVT